MKKLDAIEPSGFEKREEQKKLGIEKRSDPDPDDIIWVEF